VLCDTARNTQYAGQTNLRPITTAGGFLFYKHAQADYFSTLYYHRTTTSKGPQNTLVMSAVVSYGTHRTSNMQMNIKSATLFTYRNLYLKRAILQTDE
jgi:hypothetical protein